MRACRYASVDMHACVTARVIVSCIVMVVEGCGEGGVGGGG